MKLMIYVPNLMGEKKRLINWLEILGRLRRRKLNWMMKDVNYGDLKRKFLLRRIVQKKNLNGQSDNYMGLWTEQFKMVSQLLHELQRNMAWMDIMDLFMSYLLLPTLDTVLLPRLLQAEVFSMPLSTRMIQLAKSWKC